MSANLTEMREVATDDLRTVEGGWGSIVMELARRFFLPDDTPHDFDRFVATLTPSERA